MGESPVMVGKSFGECLKELTEGRKAYRMEWPSSNAYISMKDDKLMIFTPEDKKLHPLVVSTGDILGEDWVTFDDKVASKTEN